MGESVRRKFLQIYLEKNGKGKLLNHSDLKHDYFSGLLGLLYLLYPGRVLIFNAVFGWLPFSNESRNKDVI